MTPKKILVVDDSSVVRGLLGRLIGNQPDMTVVATASNGELGVRAVDTANPDLVVMDIEMPVMTGIEAVGEIRKKHARLPIVMFSTLTSNGAAATLRAIDAGASDFALKPSSNSSLVGTLQDVQQELLDKMRNLLGIATQPALRSSASAPVVSLRTAKTRSAITTVAPSAIVIGSSTGGPMALDSVMRAFIQPLRVPIFTVQHMPRLFTKALAERLNRVAATTVVEAEDGMIAEPGYCYIAQGGKQMRLQDHEQGVKVSVYDGELVNSCRPSVDPLFESAADVYGSRLVAAILTGMGSDGTTGAGKIAALGCQVIAQDEASSVVYGMPRAVAEAGHASEVLPIDRIGPRLAQLAGSHTGRVAV